MTAVVLLLLSGSAQGALQSPRLISTKLSSPCVARIAMMAEGTEDTSEEYPIFTLKDQNDGWDDVRNAIRERQKPWMALTDWYKKFDADYVSPTVRWSKVLGQELLDLADSKGADTKRISAAKFEEAPSTPSAGGTQSTWKNPFGNPKR